MLLCHLLQKPRSFLFAWPEATLSVAQREHYNLLIERRLQGEPIAHITGIREFWSLALKVSPATLIPRPETELLVERALEIMQALHQPSIADLGTGSGAIALAIASERPDCMVIATDAADDALKLAQDNAQSLRLSNVAFRLGNWFDALPEDVRYDLIVSNPPYIAEQDPHLKQGDLPREPARALISGADGLHDIRLLVCGAGHHLRGGGWLLIEHGYDQGAVVRELFQKAGFSAINTLRDLAGQERISEGAWPD